MAKPAHAAKLIVHDADKLKPRDVKELLDWIYQTATFLKKHQHNLARRFTSRLMN
jgi:hypothetical protein